MRRALLFGLLFSGVAHAGVSDLPQYPGSPLIRMGQALQVSGQLYRLGYFTTGDALGTVAQYFLQQWAAEGVPTSRAGDFREEGVVSGILTRSGLQKSVVLVRHAGRTLGFCVLKDLWRVVPGPPAPGSVRLEGTLFEQTLLVPDAPSGAWTQSLLVGQPLGELQSELLRRTAAKGYALKRVSRSREGRVFLQLTSTRGELWSTLLEVGPQMTAVLNEAQPPPGSAP